MHVRELSKAEVEIIIAQGGRFLSGGVMSPCWQKDEFVFKNYQHHKSPKYSIVLPPSRAKNEWIILDRLYSQGTITIPKLIAIYASETDEIFVSQMEYKKGELLLDMVLKSEFKGELIGKTVGSFLSNLHQVDFKSCPLTPHWTIDSIMDEKMDKDLFRKICKCELKQFSNVKNNLVLNWGDANIKNIIVNGSECAFIDFDQCVFAPKEFDLGYCISIIDIYHICGYISNQEFDNFYNELLTMYQLNIDYHLLKLFWGLALFYRREGFGLPEIAQHQKNNEIIQRSIELVKS